MYPETKIPGHVCKSSARDTFAHLFGIRFTASIHILYERPAFAQKKSIHIERERDEVETGGGDEEVYTFIHFTFGLIQSSTLSSSSVLNTCHSASTSSHNPSVHSAEEEAAYNWHWQICIKGKYTLEMRKIYISSLCLCGLKDLKLLQSSSSSSLFSCPHLIKLLCVSGPCASFMRTLDSNG